MANPTTWHRMIRVLVLSALVGGGSYTWYRYQNRLTPERELQERIRTLEEEKHRLELQKQHLKEFVSRLTSQRRVADIFVTGQTKNGDQIESTTLQFVEYNRKGEPLLPKLIPPIKGNVIHVDALVVRFDEKYIEQNDPLRGHSLALFYRIYGDHQTPAEGYRLDEPGKAPGFYCDNSLSPDAQAFEAELWKNFWRLAEDPPYRKEKGVSLVQGEGPWTYMHAGHAYTLSVQGDGGLSIQERPLTPAMREALTVR